MWEHLRTNQFDYKRVGDGEIFKKDSLYKIE